MREGIQRIEELPWVTTIAHETDSMGHSVVVFGSLGLCGKLNISED